jgi:hypothetical protein
MKKLRIALILIALRIFKKLGFIKDLPAKYQDDPKVVYNYNKDKAVWIHFKNGTKMKLRQHVKDVAIQITKVSNNNYEQNRNIVVAYYNKYGLSGMHDKIIEQFDVFNIDNKNK